MDYAAHLRETAQHLIRMADDPLTSGSKGQAAHTLAWLKAQDPIYEALPELITEERARMRAEGKA